MTAFVPGALAAQEPPDPLRSGYVAHRVVNSKSRQFADFEAMAANLAQNDVIVFGEQHNDPATHRMQLALLDAIARRRGQIALSLEMFERDVQPALNDYLAQRSDEAKFLSASRPWPRYRSDYRPLVEFARQNGWPVVAANMPRPLAAAISRSGFATLDTLPQPIRTQVAAQLHCPENDEYFKRFSETMSGMTANHGGAASAEPAITTLTRIYQAQCAKDETMAESVAQQWQPGHLVIHITGAFHGDFGLGTVARIRARLPKAKIAVVTALPVSNLDTINPKAERKRADWLLYLLAPAPSDTSAAR